MVTDTEVVDTKLRNYQVGDIVYAQLTIPLVKGGEVHIWRKVRIIRFHVFTVGLECVDSGQTNHIKIGNIALTEDQYRDMQLEKRFSIW